jgi:hypothetical protein
MRRVVWSAALTGLGVFLIVLALLLKFLVPAQAIKFPLNEYTTSTLQANGASYFSDKNLTEESGITLQITNTTKGDVTSAKAIGGNVAVWDGFAAMEDVTNHLPVSIPVEGDALAFDRTTGQLVQWSGNEVGGQKVTSVSGQGNVWPLGTQKKNYEVFDTTLLKPVLFKYEGTATTSGVSTYKFVADVPPTQTGTIAVPASFVGMPGGMVTLPEFYSVTKTYYVDPVTGAPISVEQNLTEALHDSAGVTRLVLLSADFKSTPASIAAGASTTSGDRNEINLVETTLPIVLGLVGLVLLVIGIVLSLSRREDEDAEYEEEPVTSPV